MLSLIILAIDGEELCWVLSLALARELNFIGSGNLLRLELVIGNNGVSPISTAYMCLHPLRKHHQLLLSEAQFNRVLLALQFYLKCILTYVDHW